MTNLTKILLFICIIFQIFYQTSGADCIKLKTSGSSNAYGFNGATECFDFVTLNTTYSDSQGNLRHGPIKILASSGALSNTINTILIIGISYIIICGFL